MAKKGKRKDDDHGVKAVSGTRSTYELCNICYGVVLKKADKCPFCEATKLFPEGKEKAMSASEFKLFRIKLPALAAAVCILLSTWSMWFLLPVPAVGYILCRALQKCLQGPAWNLSLK